MQKNLTTPTVVTGQADITTLMRQLHADFHSPLKAEAMSADKGKEKIS
jgi:hypothetical protein